jgi:dolichol kinase
MNIYLRKGWHLLGLAFPALFYFGLLSRFGTLVLVGGIVAGAVVLEILRFTVPAVATAFAAVFRRIMRDGEFRALNATIPYLAATFVVLLIFPRVIACAALVFLALGDAAAELVGRAVGRVRLVGPKTLEGTLACFAVCFLAGWYFLGWELALVGAGVAAGAELLSGGWVDNFSIPLAAGGAVWLTSYYLHIGTRL